MTNALILGMLAMLVASHGVDHQTLFWIYWWAAIIFNAMIYSKWR